MAFDVPHEMLRFVPSVSPTPSVHVVPSAQSVARSSSASARSATPVSPKGGPSGESVRQGGNAVDATSAEPAVQVHLDPISIGESVRQIPGRGVHVHPRPACLESAARKGFSRSLRRPVRTSASELSRRVGQALSHRISALLLRASRGGKLGRVESVEALKTPEFATKTAGELLVVARDASSEVMQILSVRIGRGEVLPLSDRAHLGALTLGSSVEVITVKDTRIALAIVRTCAWATAVRPASGVEDS